MLCLEVSDILSIIIILLISYDPDRTSLFDWCGVLSPIMTSSISNELFYVYFI